MLDLVALFDSLKVANLWRFCDLRDFSRGESGGGSEHQYSPPTSEHLFPSSMR